MKFADVLEIKNGRNQKQVENPNGKYPIYGSGGVMGRADAYICEADTVIVGRKGTINNPIYVDEPFWNVDTAFGLVANKELLLPKYLYYFCCYFDFESLNTTVTIPSLTKANLLNIEINIPSIAEQGQVVGTLNKISELISLRKTQIYKLEQLTQSRFIEMFGDPNLNDKGLAKGVINDIGTCVAGATPSTQVKEYWENGVIPWMSSGEVNKGRIFETDTKITQLGYDSASTKLVPPKTVVLAMAGQGKTRGTAAITEIELCTNQSICSIVNNEKINAEYLLHFLKLQYVELRGASTSADGRGGLNLKIIGNYPIIIPPLDLQNQFAAFVEQIDKSKVDFALTYKKSVDMLNVLGISLCLSR